MGYLCAVSTVVMYHIIHIHTHIPGINSDGVAVARYLGLSTVTNISHHRLVAFVLYLTLAKCREYFVVFGTGEYTSV